MSFPPKMKQRNTPTSNKLHLILLLLVLPLTLVCNKYSESVPEDTLGPLLKAGHIELIHEVPLQFDTYHVQGLEVTEQFYFITSVDRKQNRGWLFKINRKNTEIHSKMELTDGALIHPGGIQFDGCYLWVPNAEYKRESRTMIYGVDPDSLKIRRSFPVDDHIGAVASDGRNLLYGVNWDALNFYTWDFEGHLKRKVDSPTSMAYQDIKFCAGKLLCSGHKDNNSAIDIIDPETWTLTKRIELPRGGWKKTLGSEGMAYNGNLYFLPTDGPESKIMTFTLAR